MAVDSGEVSAFEVVCGGALGLVGRESVLSDFGAAGGVSRGPASAELVGVTVGAIIGFEGAAFPAAEVSGAWDCSNCVSVCVKLKTGTSIDGGLYATKRQSFEILNGTCSQSPTLERRNAWCMNADDVTH